VPIHPTLGIQDWDAPRGAIDWNRLVTFLKDVKVTGEIPEEHKSHDHLNEQKEVPVSEEVERWKEEFDKAGEEAKTKGEEIVWGLVDGFLLYWHPDVVAQLDVRVFLRVPQDVLKQRRHERHGYHTAEGALWRDPPHYWEDIVWPAYVQASAGLFVNGDVENGAAASAPQVESTAEGEWQGEGETGGARPVKDLLLVEALKMSMDEMVDRVCEVLVQQINVAPSATQNDE